MKPWLIVIMIIMSLSVSTVIARLSEKKWGKNIRVGVFFLVMGMIWIFFWLGTL